MPQDFEQLLQDCYERFLQPGNVAIDAGGHVGRHAIPMARKVGLEGKIFVFEPLEDCRTGLRNGIREQCLDLEKNLIIHDCALGEFDGPSEFVLAVDYPGFSGLQIRTYDMPMRTERIPVQVRRLDTILPPLSALHFIKLDVEGGELGILRGGQQTLARFRPVVSFEFGACSIWAYGITTRDMADFWQNKNYAIHDILGNALTHQSFIDSSELQNVWDYVAIPREKQSLASRLFPA